MRACVRACVRVLYCTILLIVFSIYINNIVFINKTLIIYDRFKFYYLL
jgi:hypothetical protein